LLMRCSLQLVVVAAAEAVATAVAEVQLLLVWWCGC
jgi:hypothetical protein